jgi:S-adenosylmethionine hydrolase
MIITFLTDFGTADSYVAEVKAVLVSRVPAAVLVDITHDVPPGDIRAAQYLLSRAWPHFPAGTVHLAVVDPAVGTERRAIAAETSGHHFVAPDNGLLSFLPPDARFVTLPVAPDASPTFHGRDVFAPAAAEIASGKSLAKMGEPIRQPQCAPLPRPQTQDGEIIGEVLYVDRFGTLISNITPELIMAGARIRVAGTDVGALQRTFADVTHGELLAFTGSGGTVEIAVRDGSAALKLNVGVGAKVTVGTTVDETTAKRR